MSRSVNRSALIFIEDGSFTYDNRVIREANALVENGWSVTVVSPRNPGDPHYRQVDGVHCYHYPKPNGHGVAGHVLEHSISLIMGTAFVFWAYVRHGFGVFHACNPMDTLWLVGLPYKALGVRLIYDQHDLCPELYLSRPDGSESSLFYSALCWLERKAYRTADVVISTNESYKALAVGRGRKRHDDVFVVRNGPDLKKFNPVAPRADLKRSGETLFGYLGNMNDQDGVEYLIAAAEKVLKKYGRTDIRFVLVGGGPAQPRLAAMAAERGLENVQFTGRIPDAEMLATLCACDVCVQPDPHNPLNDKSTMNKVLEYMALGKPVVAFDLTETRVSGGDAVAYVTPNDVEEMAQRFLLLAERPEERERMGVRGRRRVVGSLAWEYSVPHLLAAYRHAVGESAVRPELDAAADGTDRQEIL